MISALKNIWSIPELRLRVLFSFAMLAVYRFLHKLVSGQISPKLLGGPGTIAVVAVAASTGNTT